MPAPRRPMAIGEMHVRDFTPMRVQRTLADIVADEDGEVCFRCLDPGCGRTATISFEALRARFTLGAGLVNILTALLPPDCPKAAAHPFGGHRCGFCYRDIG